MIGVFGIVMFVGFTFCCLGGQVSSSQKCSLKTFLRDVAGKRHEVKDFCVDQFNTANCKRFVQTFDYNDLPHGLQLQPGFHLPVEKPYESDAHLEPFFYNYLNVSMVPGMFVNFGPPHAPHSRSAVKGYLLIFEWMDPVTKTTSLGCRMFKVKDTDRALLLRDLNERCPICGFEDENHIEDHIEETQLEFSFDMRPLASGVSYNITLYSMPPPSSLNDSRDDNNFVARQFTSGTAFGVEITNPGDWVPTVTAMDSQDGQGSVEVTISHAPTLLNLTLYNIMLLKQSHSIVNPLKQQIYKGQFAEMERVGHVSFDKLESGRYKVVVRVKDPFRNVPGQCLCWITVKGIRKCRNSCGSVATEWFTVSSKYVDLGLTTQASTEFEELRKSDTSVIVEQNATVNPLAVRRRGSWVSTDSVIVEQNGTDSREVRRGSWVEENKTFLAVGTSLTVVVLITLNVVVGWKYRHRGCPTNQKAASSSDKCYPGPPAPSTFTVPSLNKKTVYIVYAEDHEAHVDLVEQLAQFLQVHCYCEVIFPLWEDIHSKGGYAFWSRQIFSRSDYILFVDSEALEKLLWSYISYQFYTQTEVSQCVTHKLLEEATQQVFNNQDVLSKVIAVHLRDKCGCQGNLVAPHVFHLPQGIPDLLKCVHKLSAKHAEAHAHLLPLQVKNLEELPQGKRFVEALKAARKFERDEPNWFGQRFGEVRPKLQTRVSKQSSRSDSSVESGIFSRQGSVSCQDITQLESPLPYNIPKEAQFISSGHITLDASSLDKFFGEDRSVFTIGTNILNSPVPEQAITSVIPPDWVSIGGVTTFSRRVRRFNRDVDPSDATSFTVNCEEGRGWLSACQEDIESGRNEEESRSQFGKNLVDPINITMARNEWEGMDHFTRHLAAINDDIHDVDEEEEQETNELSDIKITDQAHQTDFVNAQ